VGSSVPDAQIARNIATEAETTNGAVAIPPAELVAECRSGVTP
jgi:hypothetical protein